jgi:hypothetical protein
VLEVLLSGAAGGVVILLLDVVFRWLAVWRNRAEERKSLLRLIDAEVYFNSYRLKGLAESSSISTIVNNVSILRNDNWDTCKLRLAQLLTTDLNHMKALTV